MVFDFLKKDYNKKVQSQYTNINSSTIGFKFIRPEANPRIDKVVSVLNDFSKYQKEAYDLLDKSNKLNEDGTNNLISSIGAIYRHNIVNILKNNLMNKNLLDENIDGLISSYNQIYGEIVKKINNSTLYDGLAEDYLKILKLTQDIIESCKNLDNFKA